MNTIQKVTYQKKSFTNFFTTYNLCSEGTNLEVIKKKLPARDVFNLYLRPRIALGSISINGYENASQGLGYGLGLQTEFVLSFNRNKWSILVEPSIRFFEASGTITERRVITSSDYRMSLNYSNIEVPIGLRYYIFLNKTNKLFVNALFSYGKSFNSELKIEDDSGRRPSIFDINASASHNIALGVGFNLYNKLELEMRYAFKRNLLSNYVLFGTKYTSFSFILGYRFYNKKSRASK